MVRTRVGYSGGTRENPSYYNLGDHTETIQIDYDPTQVSYEELLAVFWDSHNPTSRPFSQQYKSIIFYHGEEQKNLAIESSDQEQAKRKNQILTEIIPASNFYLAEDYHQKYYLQAVPSLNRELSDIYPDIDDFISSTAVARANGYAGGYGTLETLKKEIDSLGLSPAGKETLLRIVSS